MSISLNRIGLVAARDFRATITSRAFLIGLLVMPVIFVIFVVVIPRVALARRSPRSQVK